jgi:hypothetical protein
MGVHLLVDFGRTYTKVLAVDLTLGNHPGARKVPTNVRTTCPWHRLSGRWFPGAGAANRQELSQADCGGVSYEHRTALVRET